MCCSLALLYACWMNHCILAHKKVNHGITKWSSSEGTSGHHLVQPPCSSKVPRSTLPTTVSRQLLNISRGGDSCGQPVPVLSHPCSKVFLIFRWIFLCFSLYLLPLSLLLGTTEESLAPPSWHSPFRNLSISIRQPEPSLQDEQAQLPHMRAAPVP